MKTTAKHCFVLIRLAKFKNLTISTVDNDVDKAKVGKLQAMVQI